LKKPGFAKTVVIGGSAGGRAALIEILSLLPQAFPARSIVVLHLHPHSDAGELALSLGGTCCLPVSEAVEREQALSGQVYLAPANYHLLVELDGRFSLDCSAKVNYSRPSIDVLFQSAAEAFGKDLIGVLLSGASSDGADGMSRIKDLGGVTLAQSSETAEYPLMPDSAILKGVVDHVLSPSEIAGHLIMLTKKVDDRP
jgi:two-component system chemotaxis response regulator CheB